MYAYGEGVASNREDAIRWIRAAAEQGHEVAQGMLAILTEP